MGVNSDGEGPVDCGKKRKRTDENQHEHQDKYKLFKKPQYKRLFSENHSSDCVVYVESIEQEKVGNKNPITLTNLFTENVKGIIGVHRINAYKIGITFRKPAPANSFLKMEDFLRKYKLKAFIPAYMTEKTGIIRYVPKDMSNEEIYKNITCDMEVISIKRFMRKVEGKLTPLGTVAVSFASTTLPQYAFIKIFRYPIHTYIPPLLQCYRCLKFNHSAKACRGEQMCSSCAGQHSYKECDVDGVICINCSGNHLAISRDCPVKIQKIAEKKSLLLVTGMLWGCTNPFIRQGTRGLCKVRAETRFGQAYAEIIFLLGNWRYVVPWLINQGGSLVYLSAVQRVPLSLAVPTANSLAFAFTALTGATLGKEEPLDTGSITGIMLIAVGTALCCWDKVD